MHDENGMPRVLTAAEAARIARVSVEAIKLAINSGALPGRNFGGRRGYLTTGDALSAWLVGGFKAKG